MRPSLILVMLVVAMPAFARPHAGVRHHYLAQHQQVSGYHPGGTVTVSTAAGPITVAADAADKFVSLTNDLVAHGFHGSVTCAATGHMPNSLHHSGRACDFAQTARNRTVGVMYHAAAIIAAHGLRDGCSFGDCGHVDTGTPLEGHRLAAASSRHQAQYVARQNRGEQHETTRVAYQNRGGAVFMRWPERGAPPRERFLEVGDGTVRSFNLAHHALVRRHVERM